MAFDLISLLDVSHLVTFLGGTLVGCAGQYFADRFTDQRRKQEARSETQKQFNEIKISMPKILLEMVDDIKNDKTQSIREFVILPNKRVNFNSDKLRFAYYEDAHPNVRIQTDRLVALGFLIDVTVGNAPIYRMSENFISLLKA